MFYLESVDHEALTLNFSLCFLVLVLGFVFVVIF